MRLIESKRNFKTIRYIELNSTTDHCIGTGNVDKKPVATVKPLRRKRNLHYTLCPGARPGYTPSPLEIF